MVQLTGILPEVPGESLHLLVDHMSSQQEDTKGPSEVQSLVEEFNDLFQPPSQLPPSHACDHAIPLIPGASPIYSRPYHFAPAVKDEIEKQVNEMLHSGLIQKSSSPFASSVILVKKKD